MLKECAEFTQIFCYFSVLSACLAVKAELTALATRPPPAEAPKNG